MEDRQIIKLFLQRSGNAIAATARKYGSRLLQLAGNILRDPRDAVAFSAFLDLREREALRRIRGRRLGGADTGDDERLLAAIAKERDGIL